MARFILVWLERMVTNRGRLRRVNLVRYSCCVRLSCLMVSL